MCSVCLTFFRRASMSCLVLSISCVSRKHTTPPEIPVGMPRGRGGFKKAQEDRCTWGSCWGAAGGGAEDDTHMAKTYHFTIDSSGLQWSNSFLVLFPCLRYTCICSEVLEMTFFSQIDWILQYFFQNLVCLSGFLIPVATLVTFWHLWCRGFQPATTETMIDYTRTTFKK